jgi:hypothetical protein
VGQVVRCGSCLATVRVPDVPPEPPPPRNPEPPPAPLDSDDRPRERQRRRRAAPPRKTGRGPLFWILIGLVILALIGAATCGGLILMMQPKWHTLESAQGGFKVDLPAQPRPDMRDMTRADLDPDFKVEGTVLAMQGEGYAVMYREIEPRLRLGLSDEKLIDEVLKSAQRKDPDFSVSRSTPMKVSGFTAREVVMSHPEDGLSIRRIIIADTRLYLVIAGGHNFNPDHNPRVKRFLNSFAITDQKLLARAGAVRPIQPDPKPEESEVMEEVKDTATRALQGAQPND